MDNLSVELPAKGFEVQPVVVMFFNTLTRNTAASTHMLAVGATDEQIARYSMEQLPPDIRGESTILAIVRTQAISVIQSGDEMAVFFSGDSETPWIEQHNVVKPMMLHITKNQ